MGGYHLSFNIVNGQMLKGEGDYVQRERNNLLVGLTSMNKFISMP